MRYLFEEWTGGENPFSPRNRIAPNRPITLQVKWKKEILLALEGPEGVRLVGGGWHPHNSHVVISATPTVEGPQEGERLQFQHWDLVTNPALIIPNRGQPITSIRADAPHTIRAVYQKAYQVVVENPLGVQMSEFVPEGKTVPVQTPELIEVTPDRERFSFRGWVGDGLESTKGFLTVDRPLKVKALYDREFRVNVLSPYGVTGDGWYGEGEVATIKAPENPSSILFPNKVFRGFSGYAGTDTTLQISVAEPLTITASYGTEIETKGLAIVIGAVVAVGLAYLVTQIVYSRRTGQRQEPSDSRGRRQIID